MSTVNELVKSKWHLAIGFFTVIFVIPDTFCLAFDSSNQERENIQGVDWVFADPRSDLRYGRDCGVYCLNVVAALYNRDFDVQAFLQLHPQPSPRGMTMADLSSAITSMGLVPKNVKNMHVLALIQSEHPVILNFTSPEDESPDHWVVFVGFENGEFRIFDTGRPKKFASMSIGELQQRWNGYAVAVLENESKLFGLKNFFVSILPFLPYLAIAAFGGVALRLTKRRLAVVSVTVTMLFLWQLFLDQASIWSSFLAAKFSTIIIDAEPSPTISTDTFMPLISKNSRLVVDARLRSSFQRMRIRNSVNLPIDSDLSSFRETTHGWDRDQPIVVICQSIQCDWGHQVAANLREFGGFTDVVVYPGGIQGLIDEGMDATLFEGY
jgi:rhodanese-related sulfurtransferase